MKNVVSWFFLILGLWNVCGCTKNDPRLIGTWRSNRTLTMAAMPDSLPSSQSAEKRREIAKLFGHLEHSFDGKTLTLRMSDHDGMTGFEHSMHYEVVKTDSHSVLVRHKDPFDGGMEEERYTFVSPDRYWITIADSDWPEYFDRVADKP